MKIKLFLVLFICLFLTGCETGYHEFAATGGYDSNQLTYNSFSVSFRGNGASGSERIKDFALLRSAEVILLHDYTYFDVIIVKEDIGFFEKNKVVYLIHGYRGYPSEGGKTYKATEVINKIKSKYDL